MADDDKALVERLFAMADEYDSGHHESWPTIDALEIAANRIEALSAENERLNAIVADRLLGSSVDHRTFKDIIAENERLREAGKDLGFYAGHDDSCDCVKGWAKGPCNCGYTETWKQWSAALGETK